MQKVFWDNPYQRTLQTKVVKINGNEVLLAATIAFSFSGGQESDKATINGLPIVDSRIEDTLIYYSVPGHQFYPDMVVEMEINWPRRYHLMRLHFAAELILEIVTNILKVEKIGAHISEDKARIDFQMDANISTYFAKILEQYNPIIDNNLSIQTGYIDVATQRRYWEIKGFSKVPCGGTHVKSTIEVGYVFLKRKNIGKGKERIEISLMDKSNF
jgi:Ser-tRNA(Ala) deacylase AlaX